MGVAYETIIQKMVEELKQANKQQTNDVKIKKHIHNVRLLCDLILEEVPVEKRSSMVTNTEMRAMVGTKQISEQQTEQEQRLSEEPKGDSIFDF